ncbi:MAG: ketol-acid reductoisomerase [Planctomycetes bacterium]|nr:ketol-acid reductoisomerase [Planctomycetota bacterium]
MPNPATIIPTASARVDALKEKTIAVLGFGTQGHAQAMNLRDSGCRLLVAQRPGSPRYDAALEANFQPTTLRDAAQRADVLIFALPDEAAPALYQEEIRPVLRAGQTLGFLHGYNIHYRQIVPPADTDVILVAPKAQGRAVRSEYVAARGVAALIAVAQDTSGHARETALAWAAGIGAARAGIIETTFQDETETDLFGEQAVLCGGLTALIKAGFETLVEAGYPPELAYFECCHEVKLIADLIYESGLTAMRERISNTARFGDLTRGPRVIGPEARQAMRQLLEEIRSGQFAREWAAENERGRPQFTGLTDRDRQHKLELIGARLRKLMWGT